MGDQIQAEPKTYYRVCIRNPNGGWRPYTRCTSDPGAIVAELVGSGRHQPDGIRVDPLPSGGGRMPSLGRDTPGGNWPMAGT